MFYVYSTTSKTRVYVYIFQSIACLWMISYVVYFICSLLNVYGSIFDLLYSVVDNVPYYISSGLMIVH